MPAPRRSRRAPPRGGGSRGRRRHPGAAPPLRARNRADRRRTATSRADLTLSLQASKRIDDPVEVRCWSVADWERVVGERNAWDDDSDSAEDLYGWADTSEGTIDIVIDQCNLLRQLDGEDLLGWERDDQIDAADAVATFAHEIQHFLRPDADEAEAECGARRTLASAARRPGATPAEATRLEALYISDIAPGLEGEYRSNVRGVGR